LFNYHYNTTESVDYITSHIIGKSMKNDQNGAGKYIRSPIQAYQSSLEFDAPMITKKKKLKR